jgi:ABC-type transport system involved in multi-copper enzyme maturation permease subunit
VSSVTWLSFWPAALAWLIYAIVLTFCSKQGWVKLIGPVLFYDMVRSARRTRYAVVRMLYAGFLLLVLSYMVLMLFMSTMIDRRQIQGRELAMIAEGFFMGFTLIQLALVIVLTPAYVAGAIADEKDRKTLEFMLATDLRNREIVLSKLLSRLANMTMLLLTGLPILSILQFVGGVDTELMLAGFAWIGMTMLGLASISILLSTLFKKPRDAISLTYLLMLAYISVAGFAMVMSTQPWMATPIWFGADPPTLAHATRVLNAGNPATTIMEVSMAINGRNFRGVRSDLATELPGILSRYAWFHFSLAVVCVVWSIVRLRAIALKQTSAGTTASLGWWQKLRPRVGNFPMLWKEVLIEGRVKINWLIWIAIIVLVLITFGSGLWIVGDYLLDVLSDRLPPFDRFRNNMNVWFRISGTFVSCLLLLMMGVRASTSITHERERDTFDALLTTPMGSDSMLMAKLVGNLLGIKLGWVWFGAILLLGVVSGGVHPLGVPIILAGCFVYGVAVTMIGLYFSIVARSSLHATVMTVLSLLFLGGGHWLLTWCIGFPAFAVLMMAVNLQGPNMMLMEAIQKISEYILKFQLGVTPPFVLGFCAFSWEELGRQNRFLERTYWELVGFSVLGLFLWTALSAILWFGLLAPTFRRYSRRIELE